MGQKWGCSKAFFFLSIIVATSVMPEQKIKKNKK
jgi:hypothetical protein